MSKVALREIERLVVINLMDNFTDILMAGSEGVERAPFWQERGDEACATG